MSFIGSQVGHIQVLESLGRGGMGEVFVGFDQTLQRHVALKAILARRRFDPETKTRFLREARILSLLDHPNICRIHDYIEGEDNDFLVLELIHGRSLAAAIKEGLDPALKPRAARQVAEALVAAHEKGLVHRDLKPQNVMLTPEGDTKLLDFGLARVRQPADSDGDEGAGPGVPAAPRGSADSTTQTAVAEPEEGEETAVPVTVGDELETRYGSVMGTPAYMSPEQARGEPATQASDMYSFGLILEILYSRGSPDARGLGLAAAIGRFWPRLAARATGVDPDLEALIHRLKSMAPASRPTAIETLTRLRWIRDKPKRRLRRLIAAALLLLAAAGAFKYTLDLQRQRAIAEAARVEADNRRDQAESLISFMLGDLRERLAAVGRLEILDRVGEEALAYFEALPASELTVEELSRRAQAVAQIGQVRMAQGDVGAATKAFEDSLALARELRARDPASGVSAQALVRSAEALVSIGQVRMAEGDLAAAAAAFGRALEVAEELTALDPSRGPWLKLLGASYFWVGSVEWGWGDLEAALARFRAYLEVAERLVAQAPDDAEWRLELAYAHSNIGSVRQAKGELDSALSEFEQTLEIMRRLLAEDPDNADLKLDLADTHNTLGVVLQALGRPEKALEHYRADLEIKSQLSQRDPTNATWLDLLASSHNFLGRALELRGESSEALDHYRAQLGLMQDLAVKDPANAEWQRNLAVGHKRLGLCLLAQGQISAAADELAQARRMLAELVGAEPSNADWRRQLADAHNGYGRALEASGAQKAALAEARSALEVVAPLLAADPTDRRALREKAVAYLLVGRLEESLGRADEAVAAWRLASEAIEPLARESRDVLEIEPWARALLRLGRTSEARQAIARLDALGFADPEFARLRRATVLEPALE